MSEGRSTLAATIVVFLLCCSGAGVENVARANYHDHVATCTITGKDRGYDPNSSSSKYRVYTQQCGTLANEDQWLAGKTASADIQGQLQVGHTYRIRVVGWRNSLLSDFPNIVSVEGEVAG